MGGHLYRHRYTLRVLVRKIKIEAIISISKNNFSNLVAHPMDWRMPISTKTAPTLPCPSLFRPARQTSKLATHSISTKTSALYLTAGAILAGSTFLRSPPRATNSKTPSVTRKPCALTFSIHWDRREVLRVATAGTA